MTTEEKKLAQAHTKVIDKIDAWHTSDAEIPLTEFLGWTKDEYKDYLENNVLPTKELDE